MQRHLLSLLLLGLLGMLAGYLLMTTESQNPPLQSGPLVPQLQHSGNDVNEITVVTSGGETIQVVREGDQWQMVSHGQYPVDKQKLATLIQDVAKARKLQPKTRREDQLYRLGLAQTENGGPATLSISTDADSWQLLVGNKPSTGLGRYLRFADTSQAWLVDQSLSLPVSARDWMLQPILDLSTQDIVSVNRQDSAAWEIRRDSSDSGFQLQSMSPDQSLRYAGVLENYVSNLVSLNFEELLDVEKDFWDSLTPVAEFSIGLRDGRQIGLTLAKADDRHYAAYTVDSGSPYWQNGFYQISGFSAGQLLKSAQEFVAQDPEPEEKLPVNSTVDEG